MRISRQDTARSTSVLRNSVSKMPFSNLERKGTQVLKSLRDFPEFSVYDEPVRRQNTVRGNSKSNVVGLSHNFYRGNVPEYIDPTASTNLRRLSTFEDEPIPFRSKFSEIKRIPMASSMNHFEIGNRGSTRKQEVHTLQTLPSMQKGPAQEAVRRRYR